METYLYTFCNRDSKDSLKRQNAYYEVGEKYIIPCCYHSSGRNFYPIATKGLVKIQVRRWDMWVP